MLRKIISAYRCYFCDEQNLKQGEFIEYHYNGKIEIHCLYLNNKKHGEYKYWLDNGQLSVHCIYVNGAKMPTNEIPPPPCYATEEDRLYYLLKYNVPLLPVETEC